MPSEMQDRLASHAEAQSRPEVQTIAAARAALPIAPYRWVSSPQGGVLALLELRQGALAHTTIGRAACSRRKLVTGASW